MKLTIALMPILLIVSGCGTASLGIKGPKTPSEIEIPVIPAGNFCSIYKPVYTSRTDTEETKRQVDVNNAVWLEECDKSAG